MPLFWGISYFGCEYSFDIYLLSKINSNLVMNKENSNFVVNLHKILEKLNHNISVLVHLISSEICVRFFDQGLI